MNISYGKFPILAESVLAIGAFDGVHIGHQNVLEKLKYLGNKLGIETVVCTFDPPPRHYFQNALILTQLEDKLDRIHSFGINHCIVEQFNLIYLQKSAESFIKDIKQLNPKIIIVGEDFRFGRNRLGDVPLLRSHFLVETIHPVCCKEGKVVSSTRIRKLISKGDRKLAAAFLGLDELV